jgi:hypothetical protein
MLSGMAQGDISSNMAMKHLKALPWRSLEYSAEDNEVWKKDLKENLRIH